MIRIETIRVAARGMGSTAARPVRSWWARLPFGAKAKMLAIGTLGLVVAIPLLVLALVVGIVLLLAALALIAGLALAGWIRGLFAGTGGGLIPRSGTPARDGRENVRVVR